MDDNDPNYLIWFLVVFLAVTLGNLASNYITAKIAEYHLMTAAGEAARQMEGIARRSAAELQEAQRRSTS